MKINSQQQSPLGERLCYIRWNMLEEMGLAAGARTEGLEEHLTKHHAWIYRSVVARANS